MWTIPLNELPSNLRGVQVVEVIRVETREGRGTEESVVRIVESYFDMHGVLLWQNDPCPNGVSPDES